ncbi:hypothetical protein [Elizabethkingia anophelis]|uniref:hypothetical protein n=1 Tax=Elizabethkingia anophelis TaxID=1117645 RepID=UPI0024E054BE|nr:hypothetical protein [Elizabethkingia anophelis]
MSVKTKQGMHLHWLVSACRLGGGTRMINDDGDAVSFHMFSDWLPTVYGKFPSRSVALENVDIQYSDKHGLATYTEIQITGDTINKRKSSAVSLIVEDRALWLHLIEEWV